MLNKKRQVMERRLKQMLRLYKKEYIIIDQRLAIDGVDFFVWGGSLCRNKSAFAREGIERTLVKWREQTIKRIFSEDENNV